MKVVCLCGRTILAAHHQRRYCDTCRYRRNRESIREHRRRNAVEISAKQKWAYQQDLQRSRMLSRISERKSYRKARQDPEKVEHMRRYIRQRKRFFPNRFELKNEITVTDPKEVRLLFGDQV